jgi:hypothetical protein
MAVFQYCLVVSTVLSPHTGLRSPGKFRTLAADHPLVLPTLQSATDSHFNHAQGRTEVKGASLTLVTANIPIQGRTEVKGRSVDLLGTRELLSNGSSFGW